MNEHLVDLFLLLFEVYRLRHNNRVVLVVVVVVVVAVVVVLVVVLLLLLAFPVERILSGHCQTSCDNDENLFPARMRKQNVAPYGDLRVCDCHPPDCSRNAYIE